MKKIFIIILLFISTNLFAGNENMLVSNETIKNDKITGIVVDQKNHETLVGVKVELKINGEIRTEYTDLDGRFEFDKCDYNNNQEVFITLDLISYNEISYKINPELNLLELVQVNPEFK